MHSCVTGASGVLSEEQKRKARANKGSALSSCWPQPWDKLGKEAVKIINPSPWNKDQIGLVWYDGGKLYFELAKAKNSIRKFAVSVQCSYLWGNY